MISYLLYILAYRQYFSDYTKGGGVPWLCRNNSKCSFKLDKRQGELIIKKKNYLKKGDDKE